MKWLSRIAFQFRKALYGDPFLVRLSISEDDAMAALDGKSVAIVGNSRDLEKKTFGSSI